MTAIAIAYLLGCFTVPLLAWAVWRYDRWMMRRQLAQETAEARIVGKQVERDLRARAT
jgi:hypothetical protein